MSFKDEEYEPVPSEPMTPLRRFYSDLFYKSAGTHFDLMSATEELIRGHYELSDSADVRKYIEAVDILPGPVAFENMSSREVKARFAIVPLIVIAPHVEETYGLGDLRQWYTDTITHIQSLVSKEHNAQNGCLEHLNRRNKISTCKESVLCPLVFMAHVLQEDVANPDFTDIKYLINDPLITASTAMVKLRLTEKFEFHSPEHVKILEANYWDKFQAAFGNNESAF